MSNKSRIISRGQGSCSYLKNYGFVFFLMAWPCNVTQDSSKIKVLSDCKTGSFPWYWKNDKMLEMPISLEKATVDVETIRDLWPLRIKCDFFTDEYKSWKLKSFYGTLFGILDQWISWTCEKWAEEKCKFCLKKWNLKAGSEEGIINSTCMYQCEVDI